MMRLLKPSIACLFATLAFSTFAQTPPAESENTTSSNQAQNCLDNQGKCEPTKSLNRMQKALKKACDKDPEACEYRHAKAKERREAMARDNAAQN
jgi:hypothetical protein